jgi:hypothetical protein
MKHLSYLLLVGLIIGLVIGAFIGYGRAMSDLRPRIEQLK